MNLDQALQTFISESRELLTEMEAALLNVPDAVDPADEINAIFRAAHTIKGSAGLFGICAIVEFTHGVESVLDQVRDGRMALDGALIGLLLACRDCIGQMVEDAARMADPAQLAAPPQAAELGSQLAQRLGSPGPHAADCGAGARAIDGPDAGVPGAEAPDAQAARDGGHWHISLRLDEGVLRNGMDPLSFLRYLQRMGRLSGVACDLRALPPLDGLDPEACYLGFEIGLDTDADRTTIESTFEFIVDDCSVHVLAPDTPQDTYARLCEERGAPGEMADMLVRCGTLTPMQRATLLQEGCAGEAGRDPRHDAPPPAAAAIPAGSTASAAFAAYALAAMSAASAASSSPAACPAPPAAAGKPPVANPGAVTPDAKPAEQAHSIRVDADKLDRLINLVGELITASAGANLAARRLGNVEVQECNAQVADLVESVRDHALQLRMVKIGGTFNRFRRVVHDVSRTLGKDITLVVRGEDTELDKTVVERISDPLTHLVRNAMDHGIETAEVRAAYGKPVQGTITLDARHDSGHIVIEVGDDGGGLDRERILAKAVQRGLVEAGRELSDAEVFKLIFEPGFSTAEQVTDLSGRGVGMDVVRRNIEALRGSVEIASRPGLGTTVIVRLPLTLAIIDGFLIGVGASRFVLPLDMVDECVAFEDLPGRSYTDLRGRVLPFIRLREMFGLDGEPATRQNIVVVRHGIERIGLVVDTLLGETQAVIKPLSRIFAQVRGISGSSILGSGDVALILDVPALMEQARTPTAAEHSRLTA
ncbi:chemotaxis protein CheA [Bordetella genomosp. 13]|uniref:chemotaxis protein CheA n=1 Tax=Bordetella genomosp. 13 TaxID=463040 RepID=UPI0011A20A6E|nr:chemotaxis protein CheA [Bordetella genomosp. 13]